MALTVAPKPQWPMYPEFEDDEPIEEKFAKLEKWSKQLQQALTMHFVTVNYAYLQPESSTEGKWGDDDNYLDLDQGQMQLKWVSGAYNTYAYLDYNNLLIESYTVGGLARLDLVTRGTLAQRSLLQLKKKDTTTNSPTDDNDTLGSLVFAGSNNTSGGTDYTQDAKGARIRAIQDGAAVDSEQGVPAELYLGVWNSTDDDMREIVIDTDGILYCQNYGLATKEASLAAADPPTTDNFNSAFGITAAAAHDGFMGIMHDSTAGKIYFACVANGGSWYYEELTAA